MKKNIIKILNLSKSKTAKDTYLVFVGNGLAGFIGMILMIVISRFLGPASFGAFSVSFSIFMLLSKFGDMGLNFAMVKNISQSRAKKEHSRIEKIFNTVFWSKIAISGLIAILGFVFLNKLALNYFGSSVYSLANKYLLVLFIFFIFYDLVRVYFESQKEFFKSVSMYFFSNLLKLVLVVIVILLLPLLSHFLIYIYVFAPFIVGVIFFKKSKLRIKPSFDKKEFKDLLKFSSWMAVSVIFAAIGENLNVFMVSAKLSAFDTGIYSAAEKFILPFYIFAGALGTVFIPRASEFLELKHIKSFIKKISILQLVLLFACLLLIPLAVFLPLILGQSYLSSVIVLQILIFGSFFRVSITPLNSVFYPLNKSIIFAIDSILQVAGLFILNLHFIPLYGAKGAAYSFLITNVLIFITNYIFLYFVLRNYEQKKFSLGT
jgi:O-antigen/teichoic acid export membrane protein